MTASINTIDLSSDLSSDYEKLYESNEYTDVSIDVGREPNNKLFLAHAVVLCTRCAYLKKKITENAEQEGAQHTIIVLDDVTSEIFGILLRFIYTGKVSYNSNEVINWVDLLDVSCRFELDKFVVATGDHLINHQKEWIYCNILAIHKCALSSSLLNKLLDCCNNIMLLSPEIIFKSDNLISLPKETLITLLKNDGLNMEEIDIWTSVIEWAIKQVPGLVNEPNNWPSEDFSKVRAIVTDCIPYIRFSNISSDDFLEKIDPYDELLTKGLRRDIMLYRFKKDYKPTFTVLPPRKRQAITDNRSNDQSMQTVINSLTGISLSAKNTPLITFCQRPGFGDEGNGLRKKTEVLTNRFEVRMKKTSIYYQYIVEFYFVRRNEDESYRTERIPDFGGAVSELRRRIFNTFQTTHQSDIFQNFGAAYDGGNIVYTTGKLTLGENGYSERVELNDDHNYAGRPNEYYIEIKNHDEPEISLEGLGAILTNNNFEWDFFNNKGLKMINAFLYHKPLLKYTQYGKSIFDRETKQSLGGGLELWRGLFTSARPGDGKVYLNVNLSYMTAYEPVNLERWICKFINKETLPDKFDRQIFDSINRAIRNIKVRPLHRPECKTIYRVRGLLNENAHQAKFSDKDGKTISVAEYFKNVYNITLKTCHIIVTPKGMMIPIECCEIIEGQLYFRRLTDKQRVEINKITTKRPGTNKGLILNGIKKVLLLEQEGLFQQAGFAVDMEMALVPAHFKEMPELTFSSSGRSISIKPKELDATWKLHDVKFFKGGENLQSLFAISFLPRTLSHLVEKFLRELGRQARKLGMEISTEAPQVMCVQWENDERAHEEILKILKNKKSKKCLPQLVFYIIAHQGQYNLVKIISDTEVGILSQCIQLPHIKEVKTVYLSNVALKLNLKLNGINYIMDPPRIKKVLTMFLGTVITWPIAAVVGSVDEHAVQYVERHRLLRRLLRKKSKKSRKTGRGNEEVNVDMIDMVYELLCEFKGARKSFPQSLIMCRSGISESEFQSLALETELPSIKAACHKVDPNYNPSITYIVAYKVRKTRFYPKHRADSDKTGNVKPGLTVEHDIAHPQFFEFYIKSHSCSQGTSRPSRYCVLYDENGFGADEIQGLLHKLCYNFQRSPGAVSIPAPIYYAQCVVKRAKSHFDGEQMYMTKSSLASRYPMYYV